MVTIQLTESISSFQLDKLKLVQKFQENILRRWTSLKTINYK